MAELFFLRHGKRIDHALEEDPSAEPIHPVYEPYDPSLATAALDQIKSASDEIVDCTTSFDLDKPSGTRKNVFIHFSPYLRCCQTADIMLTNLKESLLKKYPNYKIKFLLLGDFALSEWIHEKMKDKAPFVDTHDVYHMYTPNVKLMKNKSACSNFRPTNTLGQYNGPGLSYKDYQARSKEYFQKLIATYDKPINVKNKDIVIVISHGYMINNFMSYFLNHPIFEEIPESKINYARRIEKSDREVKVEEDGDLDTSMLIWKLFKDALGIIGDSSSINTILNLETDIVYYKTNFIKKDELNKPEEHNAWTPSDWDYPRKSFKIETVNPRDEANGSDPSTPVVNGNHQSNNKPKPLKSAPICAAAKDWVPDNLSSQYKMSSLFLLKKMDLEAFKEDYDITNRPLKPISPEISPTSEPTRNNSVIDLSKLIDNDEIYKPVKLRYSTASEIPIHKLNSKVNSQVNLAQAARSNGSSANSSIIDFSKFVNSMQLGNPITISSSAANGNSGGAGNRKRSLSNPIVQVVHDAKDSYFPLGVRVSSPSNANDLQEPSPNGSGSDLNLIQEQSGYTPQNESRPNMMMMLLNRSTSLNHKKKNPNAYGLLAKYIEKTQAENNKSNEDIQSNFEKDKKESSSSSSSSSDQLGRITEKQQERATATALQNKLFELSFADKQSLKDKDNISPDNSAIRRTRSHSQSQHTSRGRRRSSVTFIPTLLEHRTEGNANNAGANSDAVGITTKENASNAAVKGKKPFFYNLDSDDSDSYSEDSEDEKKEDEKKKNDSSKKKGDYVWFGQNRV